MIKNRILNTDAVSGMASLPGEVIPFSLTSPPFDGMREYGGGGWDFDDFRPIADELWRVTTPGGVVCWVVQDQIRDGDESGTADEQKRYFRSLGFRLYQTVYLVGDNARRCSRHYYRTVSLGLVLAKGRPTTVNLLTDRPNRQAGRKDRMNYRARDGTIGKRDTRLVADHGIRTDVWPYGVGFNKSTRDHYVWGHGGVMPEEMAADLILSYSNPGDLCLDVMAGTATTCKMALLNDRYYLGFEPWDKAYEIARRRMEDAHREYLTDLDDFFTFTSPANPPILGTLPRPRAGCPPG